MTAENSELVLSCCEEVPYPTPGHDTQCSVCKSTFTVSGGYMNCSTCGASMSHFKNPDRWLCPKEGDHARIIAAQRQGGGTGARNTGQARPKSKDNLPKNKDDPKKK